MFVGNQDAVDVVKLLLDGYQARESFFFPQSGIDKEASLLSFEQSAIARAS
jgi:hypothetical protein